MTARRHAPPTETAMCEGTPATVVSLPTALPPEHCRQETARCRDGEDARLFKIRFPWLVRNLHALGPKPLSDFLKELLGNDDVLRADAMLLLEKYNALDPEMVRALGGDTFTPTIFAVGST